MTILNRIRTAAARSAEHRRQVRKLSSELAGYRTPAERAELEAILQRHGTTVPELLQSV